MTDIAYKPLTAAEKVVYDLIWTPMLKAGEIWIEGAVPLLAVPGIREVEEETLKLVTDWAFHQFVLIIDVQAIRLVNAEHQKVFESESLKLKIVLLEKGADSNEYKAQRDAALAAQSRFTNISAGQPQQLRDDQKREPLHGSGGAVSGVALLSPDVRQDEPPLF